MKNKMMERPFFDYSVRQRIDNEMFCITDLLKVYEEMRSTRGWVKKDINEFFSNKEEQEFLLELVKEADLVKPGIPGFMEVFVRKKFLIDSVLREIDMDLFDYMCYITNRLRRIHHFDRN